MSDRHQVSRTWNQMTANLKQMELNLLKLLRHPDARLDEVATAKTMYADAYARLVELQPKVEDALGRTTYALNHISLTDQQRRTQ